jgi:hypothetical protein
VVVGTKKRQKTELPFIFGKLLSFETEVDYAIEYEKLQISEFCGLDWVQLELPSR